MLYLCFSSQENALQWCHQWSAWPPDLSVLQVAEVLKKHTITLQQLLVFYITIDLSVLQVAEVLKKHTITLQQLLVFYITIDLSVLQVRQK